MRPAEKQEQSPGDALRDGFLDWLVENQVLTPVVADRVASVQRDTSDRLGALILKLGLRSEAALADDLTAFCGLTRLTHEAIPSTALDLPISDEFIRARELVPLQLTADAVMVACWDALDDYGPRAMEFALGRPVVRSIGTREQIQKVIAALYARESSDDALKGRSETAPAEEEELDRLKDLASEEPVIRLVQRLINEAVRARASDIHLEPSEEGLHVRLRMDGLLREFERHGRSLSAPVISRIKVMAGLDIAERRLPQDGRIRVSVQGKEIDFRVATSPTLHGESVVLRILDRQDVALDFDALGFDAPLKSALREAIGRPFGIVLVTGPTGSGKTTTLYAALKEINTPERKILTVEDPVEYTLAGVNQVPVRPQIGLSFAHALRSFLRQDPDVLMVGEIRDRETADIAIQAALTGHLLFSTLHTNSAAAAITRLLDMGIDDYLLTSTLHVILGQRLVRRLCIECRKPFTPSSEVRERFSRSETEVWYRATGCPACQGTGFRGRTTIIEALQMTDRVRTKVLERADAHSIEKVAVSEGMRTMLEHGLQRVAAGVTTLEEVLRVASAA
jgi:general secretion pathway protein E